MVFRIQFNFFVSATLKLTIVTGSTDSAIVLCALLSILGQARPFSRDLTSF